MVDYVVTAANVLPSANAQMTQLKAGTTITRGQSIYVDPNTGFAQLYKANGAGAQNAFFGIALEDVAVGQPVLVCTSDPQFTPGFTIAAGAVVIGSGATAGDLAPVADNVAGWFLTIVGVGIGSNKINFSPSAAGVST